ncbi:MAG: sporulation protein YabP [Clostridiales bacterium]|nr:sporulation protein YabP [Clostridiales bacterium]
MEERVVAKSHKLVLTNRQMGNFSGILDVLSFDISEVLLEPEMGLLHIKGQALPVNRLNLEKGEVDIEGEVDSMEYTQLQNFGEKKKAFFGKLFS